jgi:hypothetical protein
VLALVNSESSSVPHGATRQQATTNIHAKISAYQIPSISIVFIVVIRNVYFVSIIPTSQNGLWIYWLLMSCWKLFCTPLYKFLHNLQNVLICNGNKMGIQKNMWPSCQYCGIHNISLLYRSPQLVMRLAFTYFEGTQPKLVPTYCAISCREITIYRNNHAATVLKNIRSRYLRYFQVLKQSRGLFPFLFPSYGLKRMISGIFFSYQWSQHLILYETFKWEYTRK